MSNDVHIMQDLEDNLVDECDAYILNKDIQDLNTCYEKSNTLMHHINGSLAVLESKVEYNNELASSIENRWKRINHLMQRD